MAITVEQLETHLEEARLAVGRRDISALEVAIGQAEAVLVGLPNYSVEGRSINYRSTISGLKSTLASMRRTSTAKKRRGKVRGVYRLN